MRGNMKAERVRKGLTLREVSEFLGCSEQLVSRWECGHTTPSARNLIRLAKLYQADPEYLLEKVSDNQAVK